MRFQKTDPSTWGNLDHFTAARLLENKRELRLRKNLRLFSFPCHGVHTCYALGLYATPIITYHHNGTVELRLGSWFTVTTYKTLKEFGFGVTGTRNRVTGTRNRAWLLWRSWAYDFIDGMIVTKDRVGVRGPDGETLEPWSSHEGLWAKYNREKNQKKGERNRRRPCIRCGEPRNQATRTWCRKCGPIILKVKRLMSTFNEEGSIKW